MKTRCFIIGNGPSLIPEQLDMIKDEVSFATNRISLIYPETKWRPTYFVLTTIHAFVKAWNDDIMRTINLNIPSFVWEKLYRAIPTLENVFWIKCSQHGEATINPPKEWWSDDPLKRVTKFGGSATPMVQLAAGMGYKKMYLLGMDANWKVHKEHEDPNHFHPDYSMGSTPTPQRVEWWNDAAQISHRFIRTATKARKIKVFNCSPGSGINAYPRKKLEDIL